MTSCLRVLVAVLLLVPGLTATASFAADLSEAEYLASFHARHPARAVLNEPLGRARAEVLASGAMSNPVAVFERESPGNLDQDTWGLAWTPPLDGRRSARKAAAKAAFEAATGEHALAGAGLRALLREAYADWALATERVAILDAQAERLRELVTSASHQAKLGHASRLAAQRIELAVLEVDAEAARADAGRIDARAVATSWLGTVEEGTTPVRPLLPPEDEIPDALETPAVGVRSLQLTAAQAARKSSGRFIEFPELAFGWQTVEVDGASVSGPVIGVAWPIPIFDRQKGEREAADAAVVASQARLNLETARQSARLAAAALGYQRMRDAALAAQQTLAIGDEVMRSAAARFEMGESDVTELLETVRGVLSARLAALDLYAAALAEHRNLELLMGRTWSTEEE